MQLIEKETLVINPYKVNIRKKVLKKVLKQYMQITKQNFLVNILYQKAQRKKIGNLVSQ